MLTQIRDLTNQRFGRLLAINPREDRDNNHVVWDCVCDCGSQLPAGFDLILCTDVCEHLPPEHVIDSLRCMKEAGKYVFLSIALFADSFGHKLLGEPLHLSHHNSLWWLKAIEEVGLKTTMVKIETRNSTEELWLHCLCH